MSPVHVLFVAPSAYLLSGLAVWLDYLLPGVRARGWRATLGLVEGPRHHLPERYLAHHPDESVCRITCRTGTSFGRRRAVRTAIADTKPTLVVSVNIPDAIVATSRMQAGRRPRVMMACHTLQPGVFSDIWQLRHALNGVACVNRLGCWLANEVGEIPEQRIHYAPCGVKVPTPSVARPPGSPFHIAYVGRLEQAQKRVFDVLRIFELVLRGGVDARLMLVGTGPEESRIREQCNHLGISHRCEQMGYCSPQQIAERVYPRASALLITSMWETGPLVAWEAMANRLPIVTSSFVGIRSEKALVDGETCLAFPVGDYQAAARRMIELLTQPELAARVCQAAFAEYQRRFTSELSVDAWHRAFESTLTQPPVPNDHVPVIRDRDRGRLARFLGPAWADTLRRGLGRVPADTGPGGEWPHTLGEATIDDEVFWSLAQRRDLEFDGNRLNKAGCPVC